MKITLQKNQYGYQVSNGVRSDTFASEEDLYQGLAEHIEAMDDEFERHQSLAEFSPRTPVQGVLGQLGQVGCEELDWFD